MANTDVTITLAGQFAPLDMKQMKLVELAAKMVLDTASGVVKPTVAQWQARLATAVSLYPPQSFRNMQAQKSAIYWQLCIANVNFGIAVAGRSNSQILDISSAMQGLPEATIDALNMYLEAKDCLLTSVLS